MSLNFLVDKRFLYINFNFFTFKEFFKIRFYFDTMDKVEMPSLYIGITVCIYHLRVNFSYI